MIMWHKGIATERSKSCYKWGSQGGKGTNGRVMAAIELIRLMGEMGENKSQKYEAWCLKRQRKETKRMRIYVT